MGKGQRNKTTNAATYSAAKENKKGSMKKALGIVAAVLAVVIVAGLATFGILSNKGVFLRQQAAMKSDNFTVSSTEMAYFFRSTYNNALSNSTYSYLYSYMGLDTSSSLKTQYYYGSTTETWFDYFMKTAVSSVKELLVLAEAAKAAGVSLDADDEKVIDASIESIKSAAKSYGYTESYYIHSVYGASVNTNDIRAALELQQLASKYYTQVMEELDEKFTKDDFDKYFEENPDNLLYADILTYTFEYVPEAEEGTATVDEYTEVEANYESILKYANELAATKSADEYKEYVRNYVKTVVYEGYVIVADDATDTTSTSTSEASKKIVKESKIEEVVDGLLSERKTHTADDELSDWIFGDDTAKFATKVDKSFTKSSNKYTVTVTMLVAPKYRDDYATKNFAHILISVDEDGEYKTEEAAKAKAEEILAEYMAGTLTQEAFEALGEKYTSDSSTHYNNVQKDKMVESINDWIFDENREVGDVEIVESDYGYHVMFYAGEGEIAWELQAKDLLIDETYDEMYAGYTSKYKVTVNNEALSAIDA